MDLNPLNLQNKTGCLRKHLRELQVHCLVLSKEGSKNTPALLLITLGAAKEKETEI